MHSRAPDAGDDDACPVCGRPYDQRIVVERGDRWEDIYGGQPLSFFKKYRRRCSSHQDVERETTCGEGERVVYFHDDGGPAGRR
ncbi:MULTISPECIES: hypothetical protein [Halorussus]|uniref:hypothetical protein n=1 Tax=Halorussus TaxID=1070314 RepID=UPI0020A14A64|nr:hypothetical protein [Halorussus vallis]USZ78190.1 hypothetical protein NGM07_21270 [Halorussus vallis]